MADYIYLLQNRLTPAQRRTLESVRDAARTRSMPIFLVGAAVRDLSSGSPVRDLSFAVQGDGAALIEELAGAGATVIGEHPTLGVTYLLYPGGVRVELGPTLSVTYPKPGQPEAQPAAILEDLRRRDFTADAMAVSLNEGSYGLLLDPLNGIADMENRELRLVSNYGFLEQPALLVRAARLKARLGWNLEERTQSRFENAREENSLQALSSFERGFELEEIFHEDDPPALMQQLREEGLLESLFPALDPAKVDQEGLDRVHDLMGQLEQVGIFTDPSPVLFPLLTSKLNAKELQALKTAFSRPGFVKQIETLDTRSKELAQQLASKSAAPSETWKLLFAAEPELVLWLAYTTRTGPVQAKFKAFLNDWPQARQRLPYALMQEMRIAPDLPGYQQLLEDLFFAQIDGKLSTPEATRAFLEPYSPPAPVQQAAPRRRAAKAARGRGRKAVEETPSPEREADHAEAGDLSVTPVPEPSSTAKAVEIDAPGPSSAGVDVPAKKPRKVSPAKPLVESPAEPSRAVSEEKGKRQVSTPSAPAKPAVKVPAAPVAAKPSAPAGKKTPAKTKVSNSAAPKNSTPPNKSASKGIAAKGAKGVAAKATAAKSSKGPAASSSKAARKGTPPKTSRTPAKAAPGKTSAKQPVKTAAAKRPAVKVAAGSGAVKKDAAKKTDAKKTVAARGGRSQKAATPAKKSVPAKRRR